MAADNQMDPADLRDARRARSPRGEVDYAKANRLVTGEAWKLIPRTRYLGNAMLSLLTKIASGYWHVADSQTGYTAIARRCSRQLDLDRVYPRLRLPERHARAPERLERARPRLPLAPDLRRRRAVGDQAAPGRAADLVAALKGFFWRLKREVRDPRLPPARLLLRARAPDDVRRPRCSARSRLILRLNGQRDHDADDRPRRAAADLGQPVHALRDVVRHGVEQGPALSEIRASRLASAAKVAEGGERDNDDDDDPEPGGHA